MDCDEGVDGPARVLREVEALGLRERLGPWSPTVVSSLASGLGLPGSDLDVVVDLRIPGFHTAVRAAYGARPGFTIRTGGPRLLVAFAGDGMPVEIVGEPRPVAEQTAAVHARAHAALIAGHGPQFAAAVRALRRCEGLKTEPAIARVLGLTGDPYAAVAALAPQPAG